MIRRSAVAAIAVTLQQLISGRRAEFEAEQELVLEALRRSKRELAGASVKELGEYLRDQEPEQLAGIASNTKGIFHELLVVRAENSDGDAISAALKEVTNYPGVDVEFLVDGAVFKEVQIKAVQTAEGIIEHFNRYPDVEVLATNEITTELHKRFGDRLQPSGYENVDLEKITNEVFDELAGEGLDAVMVEGISSSALIFGALQARALLSGRDFKPKRTRELLEAAGITVGTAFTVDVLLGMV